MNVHPITKNCEKHYRARHHVCFGVSPFNSYFSEEQLIQLALWGKKEFREMHFFLPDVPSAYTLEAIGYDSQEAEKKARRQGHYLYNKIESALREAGFNAAEAWEKILDWDKLSRNEIYQTLYRQTQSSFESHANFKNAVIQTSKWVLQNKVPNVENLTFPVLESAARYLIAEIPLFIDSAAIAGVASSVFSYQQCPDLVKNLYNGLYPLKVSENQGFLLLNAVQPHTRQEAYLV